jgi:hypothetical protein
MRERKNLAARGIQICPCGNMQSCINPRTGSAHYSPRKDALDSAGSLSGFEKFSLHFQEKPSYQQKEKVAREFCFWLFCSKGGSPSRQNPQECRMVTVTSQADCLQLGTADTDLSPWREEGPTRVAKMSWGNPWMS